MVAFSEVLQCKPPKRVDRLQRGLAEESGLEWREDSSHSFDFASSAECTPEIGQSFLARCSEKIPVSLPHDGGCASEFSLSMKIEKLSPRTLQERLNPSTSSSRHAGPRQPSSPTRLAPAHLQKTPSTRFDNITTPTMPSSNCRWLRPDKPFLSWPQWLRQLVNAGTLHHEEGVVICGSVVRRTMPCLKPKVLMLTDTPRLLLLDSSGLRLMSEIPLAGRDAGHVVAKSISDFELLTPQTRYRCYDVHGAEEWKSKIEAAVETIARIQS